MPPIAPPARKNCHLLIALFQPANGKTVIPAFKRLPTSGRRALLRIYYVAQIAWVMGVGSYQPGRLFER